MDVNTIKRRLTDLNDEIQKLPKVSDCKLICSTIADRYVKGVLDLPLISNQFKELALMRKDLESDQSVRDRIEESLDTLKEIASNIIDKVGKRRLKLVFVYAFDDVRILKSQNKEINIEKCFSSRSYLLWDRKRSLLNNLEEIDERQSVFVGAAVIPHDHDEYFSQILDRLNKRKEFLLLMLRGTFEDTRDNSFLDRNLELLNDTYDDNAVFLEEKFISEPRSMSSLDFEELYSIFSNQKVGRPSYYELISTEQNFEALKNIVSRVTKELLFYVDSKNPNDSDQESSMHLIRSNQEKKYLITGVDGKKIKITEHGILDESRQSFTRSEWRIVDKLLKGENVRRPIKKKPRGAFSTNISRIRQKIGDKNNHGAFNFLLSVDLSGIAGVRFYNVAEVK